MRLVTRLAISLATLALVAGGLLYLRLLQGPIHLQFAARHVMEAVNADLDGPTVEIADMILTLGEHDAPAGLQFVGVRVRARTGDAVIDIPRVRARFLVADLIEGHFRPTEIEVLRPKAQIVRTRSGELVLGIGEGQGILLSGPPGGQTATGGWEIVDSAIGEALAAGPLGKLSRVGVVNAELIFDDRITGRYWHAPGAELRAERSDTGARVFADVSLAGGMDGGAAFTVALERHAGADRTDIRVTASGIDRALLESQLPEAAALGAYLDGSIGAQVSASLSGVDLTGLSGVLAVRPPARTGKPGGATAEIAFRYDPDRARLHLDEARFADAGIGLSAAGIVDLDWSDGVPTGAQAQIDIGDLLIDRPEEFAAPIRFDRGQVTARWHAGSARVELPSAWLARDAFHVSMSGRLLTGDVPVIDLQALTGGIGLHELLAYFPRTAIVNARSWMEENITAARLDRVVAQVRIGDGEPRLAVDFDYSALESTYLGRMPPIREAGGRASVSMHRLALAMEEGRVDVPGAGRIDLAGSEMEILSFNGLETPANIRLNGTGSLRALLTLLDSEPLGLVGKIGLEPARVAGTVQANAQLRFPLIGDLRIDQVGVDTRAVVRDLAMPLVLGGQRQDVTAERLDIAASETALSVAGRVRLAGAALDVAWQEDYGSRRGRSLELAGTLSARARRALGVGDLPVDGPVPVELEVSQSGGEKPAFDVRADLTQAAVRLDALGWRKLPGDRGRLTATGRHSDAIDIGSLALDAAGLEFSGAVRMTPQGQLDRLRIDRLQMPGRVDVTGEVLPRSGGGFQVRLGGRLLDVSDRLEETGDDDPGPALEVALDLEQLRLSDDLQIGQARGRFSRTASGATAIRLSGRLGGSAPIEATVDLDRTGAGSLLLESGAAGAALRAAGIYADADGGTLRLDGRVAEGGTVDGRLLMQDVTVESRATFSQVLDQGGLPEAGESVRSGGVRFRKVRIPFSYAGGRIRLTDAVALSSALSITADGDVDQKAGTVDIRGVISPAYGLTGALDEIPVIGELLTGGKGEGILAMTFSLDGSLENPSVSVNPLSLLTPGFLRNIFNGGGRTPEQAREFHERIRRKD